MLPVLRKCHLESLHNVQSTKNKDLIPKELAKVVKEAVMQTKVIWSTNGHSCIQVNASGNGKDVQNPRIIDGKARSSSVSSNNW